MSDRASDKPAEKAVTPFGERSPGRRKGARDKLPRKPAVKLDIRKKRKFLKTLKECGSISQACNVSNVSRGTIYSHMRSDPDFKRMVEEAREAAFGLLEEYAYKRVVDGETIVKKDGEGNIIETVHKPASAALVGRLLDATETYKKEGDKHVHIHQNAGDAAIAKLAQALGVNLDNYRPAEVVDAEFTEVDD